MNQTRTFPEYDGGDRAGARRMRRAWRFAVVGGVFFAVTLWFLDVYWGQDLAERQYVMALTLPDESARPILRQVAKRDAENREFPTPKYVAALAEREEADLVLPTYEKAYKLDPSNAELAIRYGCRLYHEGRYVEARERFREAGIQTANNALPRYLEAAALAALNPEEDGLGEALALVAKTNSAGDPVLFPQPLWADALPTGGLRHTDRARRIVDECCAPLYTLADTVVGQARSHIALNQVQYWDSWLDTLGEMGESLANARPHGALPAIAGIRIQRDAIQQREDISALGAAAPDPRLVERRADLRNAAYQLAQFEQRRDPSIALLRRRFKRPLVLIAQTLAAVALAYLLAYILTHLLRARRVGWALPHSRLGIAALVVAPTASLGLLALFVALQHLLPLPAPHGGVQTPPEPWLRILTHLWHGVLIGAIVFGLLYPRLRLPRVAAVLQNHGLAKSHPELHRAARAARRTAAVSFLRRYYGALAAALTAALALWALAYRVAFGLYPWQLDLLVSGFTQLETETAQRVLQLLATGP